MITLSATGYIQVHAYASSAELPLADVAVTVTATDGTAIAMRLTDRSGRIDPITVPVPDAAESQAPDPEERPFTVVDLTARLQDYEQIFIEGLQVFPGITTDQNLELIPLSELPESRSLSEAFETPAQNL